MTTLKNLTYDISQIHLPNTKGDVTPPVSTPITMADPIVEQNKKIAPNKAVQISASPWGNAMPISIGARAVTGKIIWSSDLREIVQPETADNTQQDPHYVVDLAVSFGKAIIDPAARANSTLMHMWAQQILCYSFDDDDEAAAFNGMTVSFHPGLIDALPDATVQADKADLTPGWRNQIYVVIKNFPLWLVGLTDGLPDFVAEIFDNVDSGPHITSYTMKSPALSSSPHLLAGSPLLYDAGRNVYYAWVTGNQLSTFDAATQTEISRKVVADPGSITLNPDSLCVHDPVNGFAIMPDAIFNDSPIHLVNLATGTIVRSLGKFSTALADIMNSDPAQVQVSFKVTGDAVRCSVQGVIIYGALLGGIDDQLALIWYAYNGSAMQMSDKTLLGGDVGLGGSENISAICAYPIIGRKDLFPIDGSTSAFNGFNLGKNPNLKQDAYVFVGHGSKVTMVRIGPDLRPGSPIVNDSVLHIREVIDVASFPGGGITGLWVDQLDHNLVVFWSPIGSPGTTNMAKVKVQISSFGMNADGTTSGHRPIVGGVLYNVQLPHQFNFAPQETFREFKQQPAFGYVSGDGTFVEVDPSTGATLFVTVIDRDDGNGFVYSNKAGGTLEYINRGTGFVEHIRLRGAAGAPMALANIITAFMQSAGYTTSQFTVDGSVDDMALGAMVDRNADLWSTMQNLSIAYDFAYYGTGTGIVFKKPDLSANAPIFNINIDTLYPDQSDPYSGVVTTMAAPYEIPGNTGITYIDADQHYVSNTQTFRRTNFPVPVVDSANDTTIPIPVIMKADEALRRSGMATFGQLVKGETVAFKLPAAYIAAEPVDVIQVTDSGFSRSILLGEVVVGADWCIGITGSNRNVRVNNRFRVGPDGNWISGGAPPFITDPPKPPTKPVSTSPTDPVLLDIPLLTAAEAVTNDFLSLLCGADAKVKTGWVGATVSTELDVEPWTTLVHAVKSIPLGLNVSPALPVTDTPFQTDTTTVLTVEASNFDPTIVTTVSDPDFLAGANVALIGQPGRWEMVYFRDVTVVDNTVQLSNLARGCRGTDDFVNLHDATDVAVFVKLAGVRQAIVAQAVQTTRVGDLFSVRARGDNFSGSVNTAQQAIEGQSLKPWAPGEPKATLGSVVNASGTPSYSNACGGGTPVSGGPSRTHLITVTANTIGADGSLPEHLVDGDTSSSADHSFHITGGQTNLAWTFDFRPSGLKQIITALTYDSQGGAATGGTYTVEASDDESTWTTLATGITISAAVENAWSNSTGFYFYRVRQDSGTTLNHVGHEFWFKTLADVAANDLVIEWKRRDRLGTGGFLTAEQPMSEDVESYDLDIFKGGVKVRTVTGLPTSVYHYSEADQTSDGFAAPLANLDVNIYQNSVNLGRGFVREATLDVEG